MNNFSYFVSWSGGKDSCLALFRAIKEWGKPACLFNMLTEDNIRSRSHGLSKHILEKQAALLEIPIMFQASTWDDYETNYLNALDQLKKMQITAGVFGDIKIPDDPQWNAHRKWADELCAKKNMVAHQPLWDDSVNNILNEFLEAGFFAKIIAVNAKKLPANYLGRILDHKLIQELTQLGINPAGELGEYHTLVVEGPIFQNQLVVKEKDPVLKNGYWFLDVD